MFGADERFDEGYKQLISKEVTAYFEAESMMVRYCEVDMNENSSDEHYGEIEGRGSEFFRRTGRYLHPVKVRMPAAKGRMWKLWLYRRCASVRVKRRVRENHLCRQRSQSSG